MTHSSRIAKRLEELREQQRAAYGMDFIPDPNKKVSAVWDAGTHIPALLAAVEKLVCVVDAKGTPLRLSEKRLSDASHLALIIQIDCELATKALAEVAELLEKQ